MLRCPTGSGIGEWRYLIAAYHLLVLQNRGRLPYATRLRGDYAAASTLSFLAKCQTFDSALIDIGLAKRNP